MQQILVWVCQGVVMLIAIPAHEAAHAWASARLGDTTARDAGRLTLDPRAHFDLFGALCMIFVGVGWAKPVGINPYRFRHPKRDMALSAAAGPLCNLLLAYLSLIVYKVLYYKTLPGAAGTALLWLFYCMVALNINLAVFNLLPIPPWDGSRIFWAVLPRRLYFGMMQYERYIFLVFFFLLMAGFLQVPLALANSFVWGWLDKATLFVDKMLWASALGGTSL